MNQRPKFVIGLVILLVALLGGAGIFLWAQRDKANQPTKQTEVTITCPGGSEKTELMADPEVTKILRDSYGLTVKFIPMGSYRQVQLPTDELKSKAYDCLWPSSASAQNVFEALHKGAFSDYRARTVLQSPEVIYSGPTATAALQKAGLVTKTGAAYTLDIKKLLTDHTLRNSTWEKLGATGLGGPVRISSTDAVRSNSGFTLAQLILTVLATQDVSNAPTLAQARTVLPQMRILYDTAGLQAASSDDGFRQWLTQGGEFSKPLYAGYESQLIQLSVNDSNAAAILKDVTMLYPNPTIYSDHPILSLTANGQRLITAMQDSKIQQIAWNKYGFRSSSTISTVDQFKDLPLANRFRVIAAPNSTVTLALLACLDDQAKCGTAAPIRPSATPTTSKPATRQETPR